MDLTIIKTKHKQKSIFLPNRRNFSALLIKLSVLRPLSSYHLPPSVVAGPFEFSDYLSYSEKNAIQSSALAFYRNKLIRAMFMDLLPHHDKLQYRYELLESNFSHIYGINSSCVHNDLFCIAR